MLGVVLKSAGLTTKDIQQITAQPSCDVPLRSRRKIDVATNTTQLRRSAVRPEQTGNQPRRSSSAPFSAVPPAHPTSRCGTTPATSSGCRRNAELARKWLAATAKATDWAMANPEAAVKAYETYHKLKDSGYAVDLAEWKTTIPLLKGSTGFFTATDAQWTQLGQALKDAGQLDQVLQPSEYYTNEYVGK